MDNKTQLFKNAVRTITNLAHIEIIRELTPGSHTAPKLIRMPGVEIAVLKEPITPQKRDNETDREFEQRKTYLLKDWARDIDAQTRIANMLPDYDGDLNIPKIIAYEPGPDGYIIEDFAPGAPMTPDAISELSPENKHKLATSLAYFLNFMHQKSATPTPSKYRFFSQLDDKNKSASQKVHEFFIENMPEHEELLNQLFNDDLTHDDFTVLTHGDIRAANIIYNDETGKFSLIDFGNSRPGNKYHDMVLYAAGANKELFPILLNAANIYNQLPKTKHQIYYDTDKIRKLFLRNIVFLGGYHAITEQMSPDAVKDLWSQSIQPKIDYINEIYHDNISTKGNTYDR